MEIVFATNNRHKLEEIGAILGEKFKLLGLSDLNLAEDIPEDYHTLEENASQKAWYIYKRTGKSCFADDTGLEVKGLNGEPGVYSARYSRMGDLQFPDMETTAGNIRKLLKKMEGMDQRSARFRTIIALVWEGREYQFEGRIEGQISLEPSGQQGFGYDPVFVPGGYDMSFAEMPLEEKNRISHRAKAVEKLVDFLSHR